MRTTTDPLLRLSGVDPIDLATCDTRQLLNPGQLGVLGTIRAHADVADYDHAESQPPTTIAA